MWLPIFARIFSGRNRSLCKRLGFSVNFLKKEGRADKTADPDALLGQVLAIIEDARGPGTVGPFQVGADQQPVARAQPVGQGPGRRKRILPVVGSISGASANADGRREVSPGWSCRRIRPSPSGCRSPPPRFSRRFGDKDALAPWGVCKANRP